MQQALLAQQRGELARAIALYEAAIAVDPANFDALHMLGVAHYQSGNNASALTYVEMALQLRPEVEAAQHNLYLIRQAIGFLPAAGEELCARALPRVARMLADPAGSLDALRSAREMHIVFACASSDDPLVRSALRLRERIGQVSLRFWAPVEGAFERALGAAVERCDPIAGALPRSGALVCVGLERSLVSWLPQMKPSAVALLAPAGASNRLLLRRIRELADEGRRSLHLLYAGSDKRSQRIAPGLEIA